MLPLIAVLAALLLGAALGETAGEDALYAENEWDFVDVSMDVSAGIPDDALGALADIREAGKQAAITLKPATPAEEAFPYLDQVDMVLVMTVEPGFGGQSFMADMMPKVSALRQEIDRRGLAVSIQVDGGINADTAITAAKAGANIAVIGSALFNSPEPKALVDGVHLL